MEYENYETCKICKKPIIHYADRFKHCPECRKNMTRARKERKRIKDNENRKPADDVLPYDCWEIILKNLSPVNRLNASQTCKLFHEIVKFNPPKKADIIKENVKIYLNDVFNKTKGIKRNRVYKLFINQYETSMYIKKIPNVSIRLINELDRLPRPNLPHDYDINVCQINEKPAYYWCGSASGRGLDEAFMVQHNWLSIDMPDDFIKKFGVFDLETHKKE